MPKRLTNLHRVSFCLCNHCIHCSQFFPFWIKGSEFLLLGYPKLILKVFQISKQTLDCFPDVHLNGICPNGARSACSFFQLCMMIIPPGTRVVLMITEELT
ncbi:MAG: hypothetical protein ACM3XO_05130, partial [Bacteroidota bacterium]